MIHRLAARVRNGQVPRLGQATAAVAVLVLVWLLFIGTEDSLGQRFDAGPGPVMTVEHSETPARPTAGTDGWLDAAGSDWRFFDPLHATSSSGRIRSGFG